MVTTTDSRTAPLAGPTAGNAEFASYSDSRIGGITDRMHNPFDIAPLVWNDETMGAIASLYEGVAPPDDLERVLLDGVRDLVKDKGYSQIKAAELYAIGAAGNAFNDAVGEQLDRIEDALGELLDAKSLDSALRLEVKAGLDGVKEARRVMANLSRLDLFGLLRHADNIENAAVGSNGA